MPKGSKVYRNSTDSTIKYQVLSSYGTKGPILPMNEIWKKWMWKIQKVDHGARTVTLKSFAQLNNSYNDYSFEIEWEADQINPDMKLNRVYRLSAPQQQKAISMTHDYIKRNFRVKPESIKIKRISKQTSDFQNGCNKATQEINNKLMNAKKVYAHPKDSRWYIVNLSSSSLSPRYHIMGPTGPHGNDMTDLEQAKKKLDATYRLSK